MATRVEELGAGHILKSIGKEEILNAINEVLDNSKYKENAVNISKALKIVVVLKRQEISWKQLLICKNDFQFIWKQL